MRRPTFAAVALIVSALAAQHAPALQPSDWRLEPIVRFWGLGLYAEYSGLQLFAQRDTRLVAGFDGAYESVAFYRNVDGSDYRPPEPGVFLSSGEAGYDRVNLNWVAGIEQGISKRGSLDRSAVYLLSLYRGRFDRNFHNGSLLFQSGLQDAPGILQTSLIAGIGVDLMHEDAASATRDGLFFESTFEIAPSFLLNTLFSESDYSRLDMELRGFTALRGIPFLGSFSSLAFSSRVILDALFGPTIPVHARQSIGGSRYETAVGGVIRGVHEGRFDGTVKLIVNSDARFNFPRIIGFIIPAVLIYADAGLYDDLTGSLVFTRDRLFLAAGGGIVLNVLGTDLSCLVNYFARERLWSLSVDFGAHY